MGSDTMRKKWRRMLREVKDWRRAALHFPLGLVVVAMVCLPALLQFELMLIIGLMVTGILASFGFLAYEVMQDWRTCDEGYKDVIGYLIGIFTAAICIGIIGGRL